MQTEYGIGYGVWDVLLTVVMWERVGKPYLSFKASTKNQFNV